MRVGKNPSTQAIRSLGMVMVCLAILAVVGCAGQQKQKATMAERAQLNDATTTQQQLEELSNAFADRYFTLMLSASERVMRDNPDLNQRRIMNGLRLLGVSSMYDIATSPDTVTQLVDQLVVVTLQNYFWVDSGRAQFIWGVRAQFLVENLRRAREDIWKIAGRVFSSEQLEQLDLMIANWWNTKGGAEFVAYVRFSEVASKKGEGIIQNVKGGGGLLEPIDRAVEEVRETSLALQRSIFWAKRVPLFANWQVQALVYDLLIMPETQQVLKDAHAVSTVVSSLPEELASKGDLAKSLLKDYRDSIVTTGQLLDKVSPLLSSVQEITQGAGTAVDRVNVSLRIVQEMQSAAERAQPNAPPQDPVEMKDVAAMLEQVRSNLVEANKLLSTTESLTDQRQLAERLKPIENLVQMRIREVQSATSELITGIFIRVGILLASITVVGLIIWRWRRKQKV